MSAVKWLTLQYHPITCWSCSIPYYLPDGKYNRCLENGDNFYCPNGHSAVFSDTKASKLAKELAQEKKRREWAEADRDMYKQSVDTVSHQMAAYKGVTTKLKKRIANGVCPCCNRTFQNLHQHMSKQHPDFKKGE